MRADWPSPIPPHCPSAWRNRIVSSPCTRRSFLGQAAASGAVAASLVEDLAVAADKELPKVPDHKLTVISGKPRERGKQYGSQFKDAMGAFLDKEIYQVCAKHAS